MATGFHGAHVIIGTIFLLGLPRPRAARAHFTPKQHFGFEAAAWYWHFVDVVWLFLFACIYVWGAGPSRTPRQWRTDPAHLRTAGIRERGGPQAASFHFSAIVASGLISPA